jgi:WD40 repeat protein
MERSNQTPDAPAGRSRKVLWTGVSLAVLTGLGVLGWWLLRSPISEEASFHVKEGGVRSGCLSADEKTLIIGGDDLVIRFWSLPDGRLLRKLPGRAGRVERLALTPDGATLFSGGGAVVRVWDVSTGKQTQKLVTETEWVSAFALNPQGTSLAFSCSDGTVRLWDFKKRQQASILTQLERAPDSLSFSASGKFLAFGDDPEYPIVPTIRVWSIEPLKEILKVRTSRVGGGHSPAVATVLFLGETHTLAAGTHFGSIELWDVETRTRLGILEGHHSANLGKLACTPDGSVLASEGDPGWLCLWDVKKRKQITCVWAHMASIRSLCFSKDGTRLVSACADMGGDDAPGHAEVKIWTIRR